MSGHNENQTLFDKLIENLEWWHWILVFFGGIFVFILLCFLCETLFKSLCGNCCADKILEDDRNEDAEITDTDEIG